MSNIDKPLHPVQPVFRGCEKIRTKVYTTKYLVKIMVFLSHLNDPKQL